MEFSLFAHMERLTPEQDHATLREEFIALCQLADQGGMRAIWTGEHHGMDFTIAPNPFVSIADLARRTSNVRLGTGTVVAPFWHPIKLAGEAAMAEPLAVTLHATRRAGEMLGKRVLITGSGPIGTLAVLSAKAAGAGEVVVTDLSANALKYADAVGADRTINMAEQPPRRHRRATP